MKIKNLGARAMNWKRAANNERSLEFDLMHVTSEVAECFEELRDAEKRAKALDTSLLHELQFTWRRENDGHPEGFGIELADVVIIAGYLAHRYGIDLEAMIERKMAWHEDRVIKKAAHK